MPKWGLTPSQRESEPWGLPRAALLPKKTVTDPIHGDIWLTALETWAIDSPPMQRLRRVRQLGTTHLVYHGATHTRFSHCLGALRVAQDLLDAVLEQRHGPKSANDLFSEWDSLDRHVRNKKIAECVVLARLGALLHDLSHVPFGHSVEDDIGTLVPHDSNTDRFERLWEAMDPRFLQVVTPELKAALRYPLILSKLSGTSKPTDEACDRYPFVADIVGNTICADLIDYLQRDHAYTGLPASLGHRFIDGFYVRPSDAPLHAMKMVVQSAQDGRKRDDVISELFKYLRYRYELSERVLVHHAKLAADAMVGKMLDAYADDTRNAVAHESNDEIDRYEPDLPKAGKPATLEQQVRDRLERLFTTHGDDGLLETIAGQAALGRAGNPRLAIVAELAQSLLDRRLYKRIGHCRYTPASDELFKKYAKDDAGRQNRRALEREAAAYAGLPCESHVALWIPDPKMRLKLAEVLVDHGDGVAPLQKLEALGRRSVSEIQDAHRQLWALGVFVHPEAKADPEKREVLLSWLGDRLGVRWEEEAIADVRPLQAIAAFSYGTQANLPLPRVQQLSETPLPLHGTLSTFADLRAAIEAAAGGGVESGLPFPPGPEQNEEDRDG